MTDKYQKIMPDDYLFTKETQLNLIRFLSQTFDELTIIFKPKKKEYAFIVFPTPTQKRSPKYKTKTHIHISNKDFFLGLKDLINKVSEILTRKQKTQLTKILYGE